MSFGLIIALTGLSILSVSIFVVWATDRFGITALFVAILLLTLLEGVLFQ